MLKKLLIRDFALIDFLSLNFSSGLTVLTGETGAGKSIILDAVSLVLGAKGDKEFIRSGASKAYVEAVFSLPKNDKVKDLLNTEGFYDLDEEEIVLSRELNINGKNVSRINGILVQLSLLKKVSSFFMEIHGQHDYQALLNDDAHQAFVDALGEDAHQLLLKKVCENYTAYTNAKLKYEAMLLEMNIREDKLMLLHKQLKELASAKLRKGEIEEVKTQIDLLRNFDKIRKSLNTVYADLYTGSNDNTSVLSAILSIKNGLEDIAPVSDIYSVLFDRVQNVFYELEDIAYTAKEYLSRFDGSASSLNELEERLDILRKIEKKFMCSIDEAIERQEKIKSDIARYEQMDNVLEDLRLLRDKALAEYTKSANALSKSREILSKTITQSVNCELRDLNMKHADFSISLNTDKERISLEGYEKAKFLIAANKGENYKELSKTASGGELSRIMLAIKTISSQKQTMESMVFDEIDTGISGETAQVVAEKLAIISRKQQVLCVTHMQQLASMGDSHLKVLKQVSSDRTYTFVKELDDSSRIEELARLLGQSESTKDSAFMHARNLLDEAKSFKKTLKIEP